MTRRSDVLYARIGELRSDLWSVVGRAVVRHDDFEIAARLRQYRPHGSGKDVASIECRYDDTKEWWLHSLLPECVAGVNSLTGDIKGVAIPTIALRQKKASA